MEEKQEPLKEMIDEFDCKNEYFLNRGKKNHWGQEYITQNCKEPIKKPGGGIGRQEDPWTRIEDQILIHTTSNT